MNKILGMFAAAAVALGQATAAYATVKQCDFNVPVSNQLCTDGTRSGEATCGSGPNFHYSVNFISGSANAQGVLLDSSGNVIGTCLRASDTTADGHFGTAKNCTPGVTVSKFRIAIS